MAWIFQASRSKRKLGDKAPWSVGWIDPTTGREQSKKIGAHSRAERFKRKLEGQIEAGTYRDDSRKKWGDFRTEYEDRMVGLVEQKTWEQIGIALNHFQRILSPKRLSAINTSAMDAYVSKRKAERGLRKGDTVSPSTVNKELRHIKAVLNIAHDWGYLATVPKVRRLKEPKKLPRYVTPDHFAAIYTACDVAKRPAGHHYEPSDWWRALLTFAYMTGWRVSEPLALRWDDVDLDEGRALTCHEDNKGNRDDVVPLHPVVVDHLREIVDFSPIVFPWPHHERTLYVDFGRIQETAGIELPCRERHQHSNSCYTYGFHDLRRAFTTQNAERLPADALQALMRHKSYTTTQRYVNYARQVNRAVADLHVPEILKKVGAG